MAKTDWGNNDAKAEGESWGASDAPAAKQHLPADVKPGNAGAGRGSADDPRRLDRPREVRLSEMDEVAEPGGFVDPTAQAARQPTKPGASRMPGVLERSTEPMPEPVVTDQGLAERARLSNRRYAENTPIPGSAPKTGIREGSFQANRAEDQGRMAGDLPGPGRVLAKAGAAAAEGAWGTVRAGAELVGADRVAGVAKEAAGAAQDFDRGMGKPGAARDFNPRGPMPYLQEMGEGAATSLGTSAAFAVGFGPKAVIPLLSIQSAGTQYQAARQAGLDPATALANAVPHGAFEAIGEKFQGLDKAAGALRVLMTGGAPREAIKSAGEVLIKAGVREIPGEVITYLGQTGVDLLPGIGIRQDLSVEQFLDGLRDTVVQSAIMGTATGTGGAAAKMRAAAPKIEKTPEQLARDKGFLTREEQAKRLAAAGEKEVASGMQRKVDAERAEAELEGLADKPWAQDQNFQDFYRKLRTEGGMKPAESAARAGMASTFGHIGQGSGISEVAIDKAIQASTQLPLDKVPGFFERFTANLVKKGMSSPLPGGTIEGAVGGVRDDAVQTTLGGVYGEDSPSDVVRGITELEQQGAGDAQITSGAGGDSLPVDPGTEGGPGAQPVPAGTEGAAPAAVPRETVDFGGEDQTPTDAGAHRAAASPLNDKPEPTKAQILAGNAALGHIKVAGLGASIESPAGSTRQDKHNDPPKWKTPMAHGYHYGYWKRTEAADSTEQKRQGVDGFFAERLSEDYDGPVFVVDQLDTKTGKFDEHKTVVGPQTEQEARDAYLKHYEPGWKGLGAITQMPMADFKKWVRDGKKAEPVGQIQAPAAAKADAGAAGSGQAPGPDARAGEPGTAGGEVPAAVAPLRMGMTPKDAQPVTVRDGIVYVGDDQVYDYDSGEPVQVANDATADQIRIAMKKAGAVSRRQKFFGGAKDAPAAPPAAVPDFGADDASIPEAPVASPEAVSLGKTGGKGPAGGGTARTKAYQANPFRAFIGKHGLAMSLAGEFAPGPKERRSAMVPGYGPIFRKTGKPLDLLAQLAVEEGFLLEADERQVYDLIARVMRGEKIIPQYAEGAGEREMQERLEAAREDEPVAGLADLRENELDWLDDVPDWDDRGTSDTEGAMRALGFSEQEISDAIAQESGKPQAAGQGSGQPDETASGQAPAGDRRREGQTGTAEGLTSPTEDDVLAQQQRAEEGAAAEAKAKKDQDARAKADAEVGEFKLTGSNRPADEAEARGQKPMFARGGVVWRSDLEDAIEASPMKQGTAMAWGELLGGLGKRGVKPDEIEWSGIRDWLAMQPGKISKEDVLVFLADSGVNVTEVVKGEEGKTNERDRITVELTAEGFDWELAGNGQLTLQRRSDGAVFYYDTGYDGFVDDKENELDNERASELGRQLDVLVGYGADYSDEEVPGETKYGRYTLPGGQNYREVLLTLPTKRTNFEYDQLYSKLVGKHGVHTGSWPTSDPDVRKLQALSADVNRAMDLSEYHSSHWSEPNVLAHIRLNDRTDADGKKVLFVEEIQSDWAQQGKKQGFGDRQDWRVIGPAGQVFASGQATREAAESKAKEVVASWAMSGAPGMPGLDELRFESHSAPHQVPDAPFVGKTDAWVSLALKRVIKIAADEGYDRVAFVNGQQSADRYDLSKQIDDIEWNDKTGDFYASQGTRAVIERRGVKAEDLPDLIGKEVAQRLIDKEPHANSGNRILKGLDLKVGGEGMIAFYDKIIPAATNKLLAKLGGGKVSEVRVEQVDNKAHLEMAERAGMGDKFTPLPPLTQPGFDVTPAMREKVAGGVPMFKRPEAKVQAPALRGVSVADAQKIVDQLTAKWKNGPKVHVVATADQLPIAAPADARGLYLNGQVWVVASAHRSGPKARSAIARTLAHEAVAHYGLRQMLGDKGWGALMGDIQLAIASGNKPLREIRDYVRRTYVDDNGKFNLTPNLEADEIAARTVELAMDAEGNFRPGFSFLKATWAKVAEFLRSIGIDVEFTNAELHGMLVLALRNMEVGKRLQGGGEMVVAAARADKPLTLPDATIGEKLGAATSHPDYAAAKAGDIAAAVRVAQALVTPDLVAKVKAAIGKRTPLVLPVVSEEAAGRNKIPAAAAELLAAKLGLQPTSGIVQATRAHRTAMDGLDRIFAQVDFDGDVHPRNYLLVDDTLTQGGTFAALASHIEAGGGNVVGVVALTGKQYSAKIQPSPETLQSLRQKHGDLEDQFRAATGYGFDALTQSEARYLASYEPAQRLRDRILEEGRRAGASQDPGNDPEGLAFARGDRREASTWQRVENTEFGPEFSRDDLQLLPLGERDSSTDLAEHSLPLGHGAHVQPGHKVYDFAVVRDGAIVGEATLEVDAGGQIEAVHDLVVNDKRNGTGRALMEAILASAPGPVRIIDIVPTAEAFWDRMGTGASDVYQNAITDWAGYQAANSEPPGQGRRAPAAAREPQQADGGSSSPTQGSVEGFAAGVNARGGRAAVTDTPAFKAWFGDSKVVDEQGRPLVVYHGTTADFSVFDKEKVGSRFPFSIAYHFTTRPQEASIYAGGLDEKKPPLDGANIMPVYLSLKNPLIIDTKMLTASMEADLRRGPILDKMAEARKQGNPYDGVIIRRNRGDEWDGANIIVFKPTQIKSATGNNGDFDPTNPNIAFARGTGDLFAPDTWAAPEPTKLDSVIYELQDGRIDLKRIQQAIEAAGGDIEQRFDARLAETLYPGRVARRTENFLQREAKPLLQAMARIGASIDELGDYLIARHAPERNAQVAKVNPDLPDGGAGRNSKGTLMTTDAANAYMEGIPTARRALLDELAAAVDRITTGTRELLVSEGLEKRETVQAWQQAYKHYAPLFKEEGENASHPQGSGFTVRGPSSKRSTGSTKQVQNVLAHVLMQREAAIARAEKNRVGLALYGLALSHPNPGFWTTIKPSMSNERISQELVALGVDPDTAVAGMQFVPTIKDVDARTGMVTSRPNPIFKSMPGAITLRINGEDRVLMLNVKDERGARLAADLKNLDGLTRIDIAGSVVGKSTRWLAAVNTQYNPAFGLVNLARDTWGGLVNLGSTALRGRALEVLAHVPMAMQGITRALATKEATNSEWAKLWQQFQDDGGRTGWRDLFARPDERTAKIEKELQELERNGLMRFPRKVAGLMLKSLDGFNTVLENAVRLAAYKTALDRNMARPEAARLARELTVDFNRKGRIGREMGPLYAFFNASVQGQARTLQTLAGPTGKAVIAGGLTLGVIQALLLLAADYDDDDIPEFAKTRSLIIPLPKDAEGKKRFLSIPYPLGLHVIPNTGRVLTELSLNGGKDLSKRALSAVGEIASAFNPLGGGNIFTAHGALTTLAPTVVDPMIDVAANRNFAGTPIERELRGEADNRPGFQRARESTHRNLTGQAYLEISRIINTMTGGTAYERGAASPTPERIRYIAQVVGGGVLRELEKTVDSAHKAIIGEKVKPSGIPVVGRFYGEVDADRAVESRYYETGRKLDKLQQSLTAAKRAGDEAAVERLASTPEAALIRAHDKVQRRIAELNKLAATTVNDREMMKILDEARRAEMRGLMDALRELEESTGQVTPAQRIRKAIREPSPQPN